MHERYDDAIRYRAGRQATEKMRRGDLRVQTAFPFDCRLVRFSRIACPVERLQSTAQLDALRDAGCVSRKFHKHSAAIA